MVLKKNTAPTIKAFQSGTPTYILVQNPICNYGYDAHAQRFTELKQSKATEPSWGRHWSYPKLDMKG
jgi:hypothetical protein